MKCVAFLRVSTEDQALSASAQRAAIERWATGQHEVLSWHEDIGVSGATPLDKCPGLLAAIAATPKGGLLVVARTDRLARDVVKAATVEALLQRKGAKLASADGVGNGDGPESALIRTIISATAVYERALIRMRTKAALGVLRASGRRFTRFPPFGYRWDGGAMLPDPSQQAALALTRSLRADGLSWASVVDAVARAGHTSRTGSPLSWRTLWDAIKADKVAASA